MPGEYNFWVYILTNRSRSVLYIGVTNNLAHRISKHRAGTRANFPGAYRCSKLACCEHYTQVYEALARESQLKKWSRAKKIALINTMNRSWLDFGANVPADD